ncbi:HAD family phosphatase [Synechococcus sp. CS-205]|uniref:HAD family hydrolase n=1 Tax=Synechococcus sp. CS-205 TaxID=2847984 RepID=UPI00223AB375|nr:HAD family phosphatase [Synechococcus sp. CS-205]MCT0249630.1 HAD family phosphatase [Synechococcus sp. CS-205]
MTSPAACLFDLDGLLLDTEPLHGRAWRQAARIFGLELSDQQLLALRGRRRLDNAGSVIAWIEAAGGTPPNPEQLLAVQQPIARQLLPGARAMPGAPELLSRCQKLAIPMALVTSSTRESAGIKCAPHPWLKQIELMVCGDDSELAEGKPAPDIFLLAARRLGVAARACWAFEDSPAGAQAALAAGALVHVLLPDGIDLDHYPPQVRCLRSLGELEL